ncbi:MAG: MFS transporter [Pyrinomonadaceae bacterium]
MRLWAAQTTSAFGSQVAMLAYPLTAILVLDATTFEMGILRGAGSAAAFSVGIFSGVMVDRMNRKVLLIVTDLGRAFLAFLIPVTLYFGVLRLELLYVITFVSGGINVVGDVAGMSFMPAVVVKRDLVEGNTKFAASESAAVVAGPGLSGYLIQLLTAPVTIVFDGVSFLLSAAFIWTIKRPLADPQSEAPGGPGTGMSAEIIEGLMFVYKHPLLRPMAQTVALHFLFMAMVNTIFTIYAVRQLGLSPATLGIIFSALGVGLLVGVAVVSRLSLALSKGRVMILGAVLQMAAAILIPAAEGLWNIQILIFAHFLLALGIQLNGVNLMSIRQEITPDRLQGRMNGSFRFVNLGMAMLGAVIAGAFGDLIGLRTLLALAAAGMALPVLRLVLSPVRNFHSA